MVGRLPRIGAVLSVTGRFARFGNQAARGLQVWSAMTDGAEVVISDDGGDPARVAPALDDLTSRCELLLGPYSTVLTRAACAFATGSGRVVWNHGGSGDDVQAAAPGLVVSVLTPTSRYAEPFVAHLADHHAGVPLRLVQGRGSFGRQVIAGARTAAHRLGVPVMPDDATEQPWALFTAGTFEEDTALVAGVLAGHPRPQVIGTVAAGVREFADAVPDPDTILGVAQWTPGTALEASVGPSETDFLARYTETFGSVPDYPAVQAAATAAIAVHCASEAGSTADDDLWTAAVQLRTSTLFGAFGIDPQTGAQREHRMALVRWHAGRLLPV